jgi:hypothetical protein
LKEPPSGLLLPNARAWSEERRLNAGDSCGDHVAVAGTKGRRFMDVTGVPGRVLDAGGRLLHEAAVGRLRVDPPGAVGHGILASSCAATGFRDFATATPKRESR